MNLSKRNRLLEPTPPLCLCYNPYSYCNKNEIRTKLPKLKGDFDASIRPDEFWHKVKQLDEFRSIGKYMLNILALPNSNAECERLFSQINDTKTKKRNRLITRTIRGNMLAQQTIRRNSISFVNFKPTEKMIKSFNSGIYKKKLLSG